MTQGPGWLDRVLSYEELTGEERADVDALLASRPEARRLLEAVQRAERAEPAGELPEAAALAAEDVAAARKSLEELLRKALPRPGKEPAPRPAGWRAWLTPRVLVPTAALAAAAWLALPGSPLRPLPVLEGLAAVPGDATRGALPQATGPREWRRGDAFALRARLRQPSLVLLAHVDPRGRVQVLEPADGRAAPVQPAGTLAFPAAAEEWTLDGEPGTETFLLAARADTTDAAAVRDAAAELARLRSGDGSVARVRGILESRFDTVLVTRIRHDLPDER